MSPPPLQATLLFLRLWGRKSIEIQKGEGIEKDIFHGIGKQKVCEESLQGN